MPCLETFDGDRDKVRDKNASNLSLLIFVISPLLSSTVGGVFLSRTNLEESTHGAVKPKDLYVSAIVEMFSHKFLIHDADEYTLRYVHSTIRYVQSVQTLHNTYTVRYDMCRLFTMQ